MRLDAYDGIVRRIEGLRRSAEDFRRDVELSELFFALLEVFRTDVGQESTRPSASAEQLDDSIQFLPFGVLRSHTAPMSIVAPHTGYTRRATRGARA